MTKEAFIRSDSPGVFFRLWFYIKSPWCFNSAHVHNLAPQSTARRIFPIQSFSSSFQSGEGKTCIFLLAPPVRSVRWKISSSLIPLKSLHQKRYTMDLNPFLLIIKSSLMSETFYSFPTQRIIGLLPQLWVWNEASLESVESLFLNNCRAVSTYLVKGDWNSYSLLFKASHVV